MTLLLNYRPVLRQPTGIGVYANAVLPALQELPHVLLPGGEEGGAVHRLRRLAWTQSGLPHLARRHRASLIFTPAPEGYLGPQTIPQVLMVHDLRPISHPERSLQSLYFRTWVPPLLRRCRHVLTNSQFTADEIRRCTGLPAENLTVIPLGYDAARFTPASARSHSDSRPYLLHVGQAYPHKNLVRLLQAFAQIAPAHPEIRLVLAGKPHPRQTPLLHRLVGECGLADQVEFVPYVPQDQLPDLYRGALAFLYPSLWEGFGLPLLEAMACGTPVLTSFGSATEETAGGAALLVNPADPQAIRQGLAQLLAEPALRSQLRARGLERVKAFTWHLTARRTRELLASVYAGVQ